MPSEITNEPVSPLSQDDKASLVSTDAVDTKSGVDVAVGLITGHFDDDSLSLQESQRLRAKLDWHLLPLLFAIYALQFIDKGTLASGYVLGIVQDNNLSTAQYNTLASAFYIGLLVFQCPQNWALQRFPVGKWIALNLLLWCLFLGLHVVCNGFSGLFAVRFLLGATEGSVMAGMMLIISMFYKRTEIAERIGWTFQCNGVGTIISGFLSFAVAHFSPTARLHQWQWLMIITCLMTFFVFLLFVVYFPDNPTTAWFLTTEEKIKVVQRVQANQNGIETKKWKKRQFFEALTDIKTWLFFLFAVISNLQNGIGLVYSRLIVSFGFSTLQTTLLNIPSGVTQIMGVTSACYLLTKFPNSRAWLIILYFMPSILSVLLQMCLPSSNSVGHLVAIYVLNFGGAPGFILMVSWVASTVAGHTKRLTTNAIFLTGYALGQILCTQFWREEYSPAFLVPWGICMASYVADIVLVLIIRYVLARENRRRDGLQVDGNGREIESFGYIDSTDAMGHIIRVKIDKALLDLTDLENLTFRYVL
ncbi:hypothetical protein PLICRDRAFT_162273 [Plicaturopsis crispa FD-325 SS-3]|nr:hypothetical protein PLICRDRAFT_162273 [Plicaturopsis crispa FD-325 SS-3]